MKTCYVIIRDSLRRSELLENKVYESEEKAIKAMILWTRYYNVREKKREKRFIKQHETLFHIPKDEYMEQIFVKELTFVN